MDNLDYSQHRSLNVGVAVETSIEAAMIYDDLVYAQKNFGEGYFYRSDKMMAARFPFFSKNTIRRHVQKLVDTGYITTKVMKHDGHPILNYQIEQILLPKMGKSMGIPKLGKSYNNDKETNKETTISADFKNNELLLSLLSLVNSKEKATADRGRALNARLKDYTAEEIMGAARAFSKSEWHIDNKQMSIDNLLAPSKFGRWYAQRDMVEGRPDVTIENQDEMVRRRRAGK